MIIINVTKHDALILIILYTSSRDFSLSHFIYMILNGLPQKHKYIFIILFNHKYSIDNARYINTNSILYLMVL